MKLPCKATVAAFDSGDGIGVLELEDGASIRFGYSACIGFIPEVGQSCWLIETKADPRGGVRAKTINLTGVLEPDKRSQLESANQRASQWHDRELELVRALGFKDDRAVTYRGLSRLPTAMKRNTARTLVEWKHEGHLSEDLFRRLVETCPSAFHPYLAQLDPAGEPEALAFVDAPLAAVQRFVEQVLDPSSAHDDVAAAIVALARSGAPAAWEAARAWLAGAPDSDDVKARLVDADFIVGADCRLRRAHATAAYELRAVDRGASADPHGQLWGPSAGRCEACGDALLRVLQIPAIHVPEAASSHDDVVVWTCRNCVGFDYFPYYVRVARTPVSLFREPPPAGFEPSIRHAPDSLAPVAIEAEPAVGRMSALLADTDELTRVGGAPSWVQGADPVPCIGCGQRMIFIAQFADPPDEPWSGDCGLLYAFECASCRIVATLAQCT